MTTKRADLLHLESWALDRPDTGTPWDANASMLCRRLKVYHFTKRVPKPPTTLKTCPRCFAEMLLSGSSSGTSAATASSDLSLGTVYLQAVCADIAAEDHAVTESVPQAARRARLWGVFGYLVVGESVLQWPVRKT